MVVGLDHDHVLGLLNDLPTDPQSEFVAIADAHPELVSKAKSQVPENVKFYADYISMFDDYEATSCYCISPEWMVKGLNATARRSTSSHRLRTTVKQFSTQRIDISG